MSEKAPLHVLVLATWYPHDRDKLIGIYHKQFCQALAQAGVKVNMLHIDRQPISTALTYPFSKKKYQVQEEGYTTYFLRMLNRGRISEHLQLKAYVKKVEQLYNDYEAIHGKPDIIHAQVLVPAGYAACLLGEKIGVPVIITEHATYFERFFNSWTTPYAKKAAQMAAKVTCVGQYMIDIFRNKYQTKAEILPNIVDCSLYSGPKAPKEGSTLQFATVCALRTGKNIHHAVQALAKLRESGRLTDFHYTVVGDGYLRDEYWASVVENNMTDCVSFVGQKAHPEIAKILSQTDILLMVTNVETFGIPAIEATAAGVPVVCTRCGGPEGFLTPQSSEFCEVGNPDSIADAIMRMVDRLPEIDEAQVRSVSKPFDGESVANLAISYYKEILNR